MRWPWSKSETQETRDRLGTLSSRVDDLESTARKLRVEWHDVLDRLERVMGRLNKRAQRAAEAADVEEAAPPNPILDEVAKRRARLSPPGGAR